MSPSCSVSLSEAEAGEVWELIDGTSNEDAVFRIQTDSSNAGGDFAELDSDKLTEAANRTVVRLRAYIGFSADR
jgi:hypothetical protein